MHRFFTQTENGQVAEDTIDWYAQDRDGNVWYMGEDTKKYSSGQVSTIGSWEDLHQLILGGLPVSTYAHVLAAFALTAQEATHISHSHAHARATQEGAPTRTG